MHPEGWGFAVNHNFTLCAVSDICTLRVYIHAIDDAGLKRRDVATVVYYPGTSFAPEDMCFVKRVCDAEETLLVSNSRTNGIVELSPARVYMREIAGPPGCYSTCGVAYAPRGDVIAVAFHELVTGASLSGGVALFRYESGEMVRTIRLPNDYGLTALSFSTDGAHLLVSLDEDSHANVCKVSQFDDGDATPSFAPLSLYSANHTWNCPSNVLCGDAGDIVLACDVPEHKSTRIVFIDAVGVTRRVVELAGDVTELAWFGPHVCCRTFQGKLYIIRDEWTSSLRAAWVTACCVVGTSK